MSRTFLGQNFLIDEDWQKKIVSHFEPAGAFLEIGPGEGALTKHLVQRFDQFHVFEKDPELVALHRKQNKYVTIAGDFVQWDFKLNDEPVKNFSFIGNLPYESGSAMLQAIAEHAEQISGFVFLLQKEVVERICAKPCTRDFASFSILVQGQFDVEALDIIPPEAFDPPPKVFSQVVRGKRRVDPHPTDREFKKFLKQSFLNKRKTARNAWKSFIPPDKINAILEKFHFSPTCRAEEIEVDLWPQLFLEFKS